jgi:nucleoside-diphosphate-sugar epimerase
MRALSKGRFLFFGDGQNMRHPVYINDAIQGLELCASVEGINGEVFIVAGESAVPVSELMGTMSKELGVRYILEVAFKFLGKQPPFSRRSVDFFLKHNSYAIHKAKNILGYQPQVDLQRGLRETIRCNQNYKKESK